MQLEARLIGPGAHILQPVSFGKRLSGFDTAAVIADPDPGRIVAVQDDLHQRRPAVLQRIVQRFLHDPENTECAL